MRDSGCGTMRGIRSGDEEEDERRWVRERPFSRTSCRPLPPERRGGGEVAEAEEAATSAWAARASSSGSGASPSKNFAMAI